ncbi:MAG: YeeE/YedE family protein [Nitrospinota bacterium]
MTLAIVLGLPVGFLFGVVLQRGRFCMYTAFRDLVISRDTALFRAYLVAVAIQSVLIHLGASLGWLEVWRVPFYWRAAIIGGLVFGLGMTLAGGCSSGTWYRVGEGMVGSFVALLGFGLSTAATVWGALRPLRLAVRGAEIEIGGRVPTLANLLRVNPWVIVVLGAAGVAVWAIRSPRHPALFGWDWRKTGFWLGLLAAAAWYLSGLTGRYYGLSITGPTATMTNFVISRETAGLNWAVFMLLALPFGAYAAAKRAGEFAWRAPSPRRMVQQFGGGVLMGFGAVTAGGCNIGHGLTGVSALALSSWVATLFTILGAWAGTYFFFLRKGRNA